MSQQRKCVSDLDLEHPETSRASMNANQEPTNTHSTTGKLSKTWKRRFSIERIHQAALSLVNQDQDIQGNPSFAQSDIAQPIIRDKTRRRFSAIEGTSPVTYRSSTECTRDNTIIQPVLRDKTRRRFSAIEGISPVTYSSIEYARDNNNKPRLVTQAMLKAMLDESNSENIRTVRRSSMDLITSSSLYAHKPIKHRRMSLDTVVANFDKDQTITRRMSVKCMDDTCGTETNIPVIETFKEDPEDFTSGKKVELCSNSPHPLIEYPPLYFVLKRFPRLMNAMERFYKFRWEMQYPLQRRVFLSKKLRKIGITATWGECLLLLPFVAILVRGLVTSFIHPSVSMSGVVARLPLIICFLTANHNSLLTLVLGIPFERTIKYHKISGYLSFLNGIFHTYVAWVAHKQKAGNHTEILTFASNDQVNMSGTLLLCIIFSMILTASPYVRRKAFEVFYYFHILFAMAMMGCAFYHSGILVPILASLLWGVDLIVRKIYMARFRYPRVASIKQLTDSVVELRIPKTKGFDYNPGQYVKIAVPDLSIFQWHPISISSSPHQTEITLHIRTRGHWTILLHKLAEKKTEIDILLEGPYGSLGVDLTSDRYSMVMLLSGGIGVTPMQSIAHQLMYEHEWGERELKKLWFVWTARDPQVMSNMDVVSKNNQGVNNFEIENATFVDSTYHDGSDSSNLSSKIDASASFIANNGFTTLPGSNTTDEELDRVMPLDDFIDIDDEEDKDNQAVGDDEGDEVIDLEAGGSVFTTESSTGGLATDSHFEHQKVIEGEDGLLELDCYLTAKEMKDCGLDNLPFINQCRPDMRRIFLSMRKEAMRRGEKRVAICVCAPSRLVCIARESCVKFSNRHVRFDFHSEVFD